MIEVKELYFKYPHNDSETLHGLNFKVESGEIFGFLGPSGAGKSTTQKILTGIIKGFRGEVSVRGQDLKKATPDYYESIGVSFEFPNLYSKLTGRENLDLFRSMYSGRTESPDVLMEMIGLSGAMDKRVSDYSKGMKMRLNFCRAFLNHPELVYLDEPTSGQDPVNARRIKDIILRMREQGKTIFLTTHNMTVAAELCDRVAFIVDGNISLVDSPRELMVNRSRKTVRVEYETGDDSAIEEFPLDGLGDNASFLKLIRSRPLKTIHSVEPNLEDIFMEVTGASLTGAQPQGTQSQGAEK